MVVLIAKFSSFGSSEVGGVVIGSINPNEKGDKSAMVQEEEEIDGGFASLEGMLQWAIGTLLPSISPFV